MHLFSIWIEKPTDVTVWILFIYWRISTCFGPTSPSSGEFTQLFPQPLVQCLYHSGRVFCMLWPVLREQSPRLATTYRTRNQNGTDTEPMVVGTAVWILLKMGLKHVEIQQYMNKIETVTSVGFSFLMLKMSYDLIHTEITNKMQQFIKIYYSMFIWSSTCFGRHTARHQELKTALAAYGFAYVRGCPTTSHVCKTRGC